MNNAPFSVNLESFKKDKNKYNDRISDCRIKFNPEDISYIIVDKTNEIPNLIRSLRTSFEERCNSKELDILFSKICSTEQIKDDY
jgi:acyl-CoA hydrolase